MHLAVRSVVFLALISGFISGCSNRAVSTSNSGIEPPHEGVLVPLPDGKSWVEIVKKEGPAPITSEVSFYFYRNGTYEPCEQPPEAGVLELDGKRKVTLTLEDDALVTPSGPVLFAKREVRGELMFELDGQEMKVMLGSR
jgi:hypothetical protein